MTRKEYNKLIRDRIPEIICSDGRQCEVLVMTDEEYRKALLDKLIEEAEEAAAADPQSLVSELADLYEVIDGIMAAYGIDRESVIQEQERRRIMRGGFDKRLKLLWTQ